MIIFGKEMENSNQKSLERVVSQRALQMGSSYSCQLCVIGLLCGICLTSLFLATLTSFASFEIGGVSFSAVSSGVSTSNPSSKLVVGDNNVKQKEVQRLMISQENLIPGNNDRVSELYSLWSDLLHETTEKGTSKVPIAPHLENCKLSVESNRRFDTRLESSKFPPWTIWKGQLDNFLSSTTDEQLMSQRRKIISEGAYPPWITGSDDENYPLTRKVQRDIWFHQHPQNCRDPNVKFLIADWERLPGFGIGAQFAGMCGLLAIAVKEKRVLVTNYYNRADHNGCKGSSRASWSCYFFPETSQECRERAFELVQNKEAREKGIITLKDNYTSKEIWAGRVPRLWGNPWSSMQPTTEINGSLIVHHRKMDRRWWRSQAIRYLMRFQTEYTCNLLNIGRHEAFGREAAKLVHYSSSAPSPEDNAENTEYDLDKFVWSDHKPWIPHPLLSMHVRMGDKACEMNVVGFEEYMRLAERIRRRFTHLNSIWLSTEMQEVIDKTKLYPHWKFYYTNVKRQVGNMTMAIYEASLGRETSTNYPLVNFLMATEADFFVGALGSTWCFLIDGMRNTGGKVMSGYLSVNKDRFW